MNKAAVLSVRDLSKSFGNHEVLKKIDLDVAKGEVICVLGSSGSGKSTLLRCINHLETPTGGQIRFHGNPVQKHAKALSDYRAQVGMVFQS